ncbi:uncharacterized protein TNCV_2566651 [Trichonephila clavipes]|uniref:DUF4371 domain-containing protein n=1 Tax=Trichonephila clavipes TaxID=2585209 RepID=A0A8X6WKA1_TRICX|nr:uncharacterized protein TNCV_2566651 [Trichonephila clavipes]
MCYKAWDLQLPMWYWDRTRDQASHDPIPIPLGYRGPVSNARELDEQVLKVKINSQEKNTVSDTSTNKDILYGGGKGVGENENEETKLIGNDFAHYVGTPIDADLREQILKFGPYQPEGFIEAANQTAESLESDVLNFLNTLDINLAKCRGQGYDGAANMSGAYGGLQKLTKDKQPRANYVHCSTYNLNLVLNDACNNVPHEEAIGLAKKWGITPEFEKKRHRKVRQFFDDFNADEKLQDRTIV